MFRVGNNRNAEGNIMMKRVFIFKRSLAFFAFVWGLCFAAQPAVMAGGLVPFKASYSLDADVVVEAPPIATVISEGSGLATHLGAFRQRSISETIDLSTGVGEAVHEFTAANGDTIVISFNLQLIPTSPISFDVVGVWTITGGTGRFVGASGSGEFWGTGEFTSATTAVAAFEMKGNISSVGSLK